MVVVQQAHHVCVMCFTAYLRVCASYRAFCVFQDSLFVNDLPEVISSDSRRLGFCYCNKFFVKYLRTLNRNTKSAILVVPYVRRHLQHTFTLPTIEINEVFKVKNGTNYGWSIWYW